MTKKPRKKKEQPMAVTQFTPSPSTEAIIAKMKEMAMRLKVDPPAFVEPVKPNSWHPRYCTCADCEVERGMKNGTLPLAVHAVLEAYGEAAKQGKGRPRRILVGLHIYDGLWKAINLSAGSMAFTQRYLFEWIPDKLGKSPDTWLLDGCCDVVLSLQIDDDAIELVF